MVPFTLSEALFLLESFINLSVIAHQNDENITGAVVLGNMMIGCFGFSVLTGMNSAVETLAS